MNTTYFSFLICDHGTVTNVYYNGLPIGVLTAGKFIPHELAMADGTKRPITINDLPDPCPFKDWQELISNLVVKLYVMALELGTEVDTTKAALNQ